MTTTLEKIKEMKIPVGTPIEITTDYKYFKNEKIKGYFQGTNDESYGLIRYGDSLSKVNLFSTCSIRDIKEIKILEYKK